MDALNQDIMRMAVVESRPVTIQDMTGNPAPLGLLAFGLTTVLLNLANAGFYALDAMILSMGIFYGGAAQLVAGVMEWKKNYTFGTTAFTSYGFFWLSLAGILVLPKLGVSAAPGPVAMAAYLGIWGAFTAVMFVATLRINRALQAVFATLALLFFLLAVGDLTGSAALKAFAGYEGVVCGTLAIYTGLAQVLNETYGRVGWPLGPVAKG